MARTRMNHQLYFGIRRGLWQANMVGLPFVAAMALYKHYFWLAGASVALLVVVVWTWRKGSRD